MRPEIKESYRYRRILSQVKNEFFVELKKKLKIKKNLKLKQNRKMRKKFKIEKKSIEVSVQMEIDFFFKRRDLRSFIFYIITFIINQYRPCQSIPTLQSINTDPSVRIQLKFLVS